ncbi:MAG: alpha/beta hydrolase [Moorea sp. SIO1F2]|uniref:alpha/beta hydrolase n=1 Tax=Moorena sp. SIO1F2 TaxID=2607819 RepID=UPI0013B70466|nr:alpha/beta hydrolase [Moorena sp. SIO1F2]NET84821.1 alpha/beta hydrolase [Moorena sp. SIO1F2]
MSLKYINVAPTNNQPPTGLIVCLHGFGANSEDLVSLAKALNLPDYQFLFAEAPFDHPAVPGGKMWYDLNVPGYQGLTESRQKLIDWLESLAKRPRYANEVSTGVPLSRTILSGFSQGGAMTLDVGLTLPIAGLVSMSGYLHSEPQLPTSSSLPPILIVHGRQDEVVPLMAAHNARDTLTGLGIQVKYQEFDMGHQIIPEVVVLFRNFVLEVMANR